MGTMDEITCLDCGAVFNSREEYMIHRQSPCAKEPQAKILAPNQCKECAKNGITRIAKNKHGLAIHMSLRHGLKSQNPFAIMSRRKRELEKLTKTKTLQPKRPTKVFNAEGKLETPPQVQIYFCLKCEVIWDGRGKMSNCPDCGDLLRTPPKRKHFSIGESP